MKMIFLAAMVTLHMGALAQSAITRMNYDTSTDQQTGSIVFNGRITFEDLLHEPSFSWFRTGMQEYVPDAKYVGILSEKLLGFELIIFAGTWCDDSHFLLPRLYKVLESAHFKGQYTMYGVNREKKDRQLISEKYQITLVPTIILMKHGQEVGRIVETVPISIEQSLAALVAAAKE